MDSNENINWSDPRSFRNNNAGFHELTINETSIVTRTTTEEDGSFDIELIEGTYDIFINKLSYLDYIIMRVEVRAGQITEIGELIVLVPGDTDKSGQVTAGDLARVYGSMDRVEGETGFLLAADITESGQVTAGDLARVYGSMNRMLIVRFHIEDDMP